MISKLSERTREGLFVVGDDDQSIYSFRGGSPEYCRRFADDFGTAARVLSLERSRRCPERILQAARDVIAAFDPDRLEKPAPSFPPEHQAKGEVIIHNVGSDDQEAAVVSGIVKNALSKGSVLVLLPARQFADKITHKLRSMRIPYVFPPNVDDTGLATLATVYDWIENQHDNFALRMCIERLCESGTVGIPSKRARGPEQKKARSAALVRIAGLWTKVMARKSTLWEALQDEVAQNTEGILANVHQRLISLSASQPDNLPEELREILAGFRPWSSRDALTSELRLWLAEMRTHMPAAGLAARIMTLQAAKGLEADTVCVIGLNEGVIPRTDGRTSRSESARLTYVSMTRAKDQLHLFSSRKRDRGTTYLPTPNLQSSSFLNAIAKTHRVDRFHQSPSTAKRHLKKVTARSEPKTC